jgi:hypothetical protein
MSRPPFPPVYRANRDRDESVTGVGRYLDETPEAALLRAAG